MRALLAARERDDVALAQLLLALVRAQRRLAAEDDRPFLVRVVGVNWPLLVTRLLEEQVEELVLFAERHLDAIQHLRSESDIDLFCGAFAADTINCGATFTPQIMARLAALDLSIYIDIY